MQVVVEGVKTTQVHYSTFVAKAEAFMLVRCVQSLN
jgi:hypothetical protein